MSGQLYALSALPREKSLRYPLDRSLGGPQSQSALIKALKQTNEHGNGEFVLTFVIVDRHKTRICHPPKMLFIVMRDGRCPVLPLTKIHLWLSPLFFNLQLTFAQFERKLRNLMSSYYPRCKCHSELIFLLIAIKLFRSGLIHKRVMKPKYATKQ
jgi:hypothetical protein